MTFQTGTDLRRSPGRPPGARNKRTQEVLDLIQGRGDTDPLDALSNIVTTNKDPSVVSTAANMLAPYVHSKRGTIPPPRYVEDAISVPEFTSIQEAQNFLADIARRSGSGELELQCATDISNLVKNWILSITAQDEYQLKLQAQGGGGDTTIRIVGGLPQLPGSAVIGMELYPTINNDLAAPAINGHNGQVIDHQEPRALDDSSADRDKSSMSEAQEPDHGG